jgi:hypothetical protein
MSKQIKKFLDWPWWWRYNDPLECWETLAQWHSATSQKSCIICNIAVGTSYFTCHCVVCKWDRMYWYYIRRFLWNTVSCMCLTSFVFRQSCTPSSVFLKLCWHMWQHIISSFSMASPTISSHQKSRADSLSYVCSYWSAGWTVLCSPLFSNGCGPTQTPAQYCRHKSDCKADHSPGSSAKVHTASFLYTSSWHHGQFSTFYT